MRLKKQLEGLVSHECVELINIELADKNMLEDCQETTNEVQESFDDAIQQLFAIGMSQESNCFRL